MRESSSWCLLCLEILNNSAPSYCSCLNRSFPLIPPSWRQQLIHPWACVCAATACASVLCCILFSVSHVVPYSGNCSCPAFAFSFFFFLSIFHFFFLAEPVFSSSRCQVEASAGAAGAGLCEELLFDVPSVARSHKVEGKQCTTALAWICSSS